MSLPIIQWRSEGTLCPGAKKIFAPPPTKIAEFEVKNRRRSAEEAKAEHLLCCYFCLFWKSFNAIKYTSTSLSGRKVTTRGSGGRAPSRRKPMSIRERSFRRCGDLQFFFS